MSMRAPIDRERIEQFLKRLDATAHQAGRVFLVGGAVLVHGGLRGRTLDIDLVIEADNAASEQALLQAIRQIKDELQVNIERSSPADFIPLPGGWHERARWVGRYGRLEVFYFDYYSPALSKINRASERDLEDVALLLQRGLISLEGLDAAYQEIKPQLGMGKYFNADPAQFAVHYAIALQRAGG